MILQPYSSRPSFLRQVRLVQGPYSLGQALDPKLEARLNLSQSYADAITAVSRVVQVPPESMSASPETAMLTFDQLLKNPTFLPYVMKLLVISAAIVKEDIRALQMTPQQLSNVLMGAEKSVKKLVPEAELPARLEATKNEIVARAPGAIQAEVRRVLDESGIKPENLVPNIPEGAEKVPVSSASAGAPAGEGISDLGKVALIGVPILLLAGIGFLLR